MNRQFLNGMNVRGGFFMDGMKIGLQRLWEKIGISGVNGNNDGF